MVTRNKIGDICSIMNELSIVIGIKTDEENQIDFELWKTLDGKKGIIRQIDWEADEVIHITKYQTFEMAQGIFNEIKEDEKWTGDTLII